MFKSISDFFTYLLNGKSHEKLDEENVTSEIENKENEENVGLPLESDSDSEGELENVVVEEETKGLLSFLRAEEKKEEEPVVEEKKEEEPVVEERNPILKIDEKDMDKFE